VSLAAILGLFVLAAAVIGVVGTRLTRDADRLADLIGWGEAVVGAVLLGAVTSLAGVVTTLTAAAEGLPQLAVGNAIGGIAVQTAFLAVADLFYRRANLEHAAASLRNLMYSVLLLGLLVLLMLGAAMPELTLLGAQIADRTGLSQTFAGALLTAFVTSLPELVVSVAAVLMAVLLMGLLHRQRQGIAGIGWESALILALFVGGYLVLYTVG
jgi:cation:H+ antiporter